MHFVTWETRGRMYTLHQRPPVHSIMSSRLALGELYYKNWIGYENSQNQIQPCAAIPVQQILLYRLIIRIHT